MSKYTPEEKLGDGGYSIVFKVKHSKSGKFFALKQPLDEDSNIILENEKQILKRIKHKNIVEYLKDTPTGLLLRYVPGKTLHEIITTRNFSDHFIPNITQQILKVLVYLEKMKIIHADLKPENIIVRSESPLEIKIIDFGLSLHIGKDGFYRGPIHSATIYYTCPEVIKKTGKYSSAIDIWSFGIVIYSLLCGYLPFYSKNKNKTAEKIINMKLVFPSEEWENINPEIIFFIKKALRKHPQKRPSAKELSRYGWLQITDYK